MAHFGTHQPRMEIMWLPDSRTMTEDSTPLHEKFPEPCNCDFIEKGTGRAAQALTWGYEWRAWNAANYSRCCMYGCLLRIQGAVGSVWGLTKDAVQIAGEPFCAGACCALGVACGYRAPANTDEHPCVENHCYTLAGAMLQHWGATVADCMGVTARAPVNLVAPEALNVCSRNQYHCDLWYAQQSERRNQAWMTWEQHLPPC